MDKNKFDPKSFEKDMFDQWFQKKIFSKNSTNFDKNFSIVLPPPNVTGVLHLGHAWDITIQDTIIRFKKMNGFNTYWIAGMDHAGIATQTKYESYLKENNKKRTDYSREEFIENLKIWVNDNANSIREQWKSLGALLDYENEHFTLDKKISDQVYKVFIKLYENKLIYRDLKLVNWDVNLKTAISDIEVIKKETNTNFYYIKYFLKERNEYLIVATTRPETMFADTCLVINPKDIRYKKYLGQLVLNPANNEYIPIIEDKYVDINYGTGVMKCTPAHDFNDYKIGKSKKQKFYSCMNLDGTMNEKANEYNGIDRLECRKLLIKKLKKNGYIEKIEGKVSSIGFSERTNEIVEPMLSLQWFVKMKPLAKKIIKNQNSKNKVVFFPERFNNTLIKWLENIEDWCISRQLWWGHRLPVWYNEQDNSEIYVGIEKPTKGNWFQDDDVFDTWFSSGMWPFLVTMQDQNIYDKFFPTSILVTAYDIIFFWVARMLMLSDFDQNKKPFFETYIHGLIRDKNHKKMSKSLGNGVDPNKMIEIYGADALRLFLMSSSSAGEDLIFIEDKVKSFNMFLNKIWNISLFLKDKINMENNLDFNKLNNDFDKWIIKKSQNLIIDFINDFEKYNFIVGIQKLLNFIKNDFSNIYIDLNKKNRNDENFINTTKYVFKVILMLIHPICPFISEKLYKNFNDDKLLIEQQYSILTKHILDFNEHNFEKIFNILEILRNFRWKNNINKKEKIIFNIYTNDRNEKFFNKYISDINKILYEENAFLEKFFINETIDGNSAIVSTSDFIFEFKNFKKEDFQSGLNNLIVTKNKILFEIERATKILSNENFIKKAPIDKVNLEKEKLRKYKNDLKMIEEKIKELS